MRGDPEAEALYIGEVDLALVRRARIEYPAIQMQRVGDLLANLREIADDRL